MYCTDIIIYFVLSHPHTRIGAPTRRKEKWVTERGGTVVWWRGRLIDDRTIRSDDDGYIIWLVWCDVQLTLRDDPCDNNIITRCYIFIRHALITGEIRGRIRSTVGKAKSKWRKSGKIIDRGMRIYMFRKGSAASTSGDTVGVCSFVVRLSLAFREIWHGSSDKFNAYGGGVREGNPESYFIFFFFFVKKSITDFRKALH